MKKEEIKEYNRHEYHELCGACNTDNYLLTQSDEDGYEYDTTVYAQCRNCTNFIKFTLPVN